MAQPDSKDEEQQETKVHEAQEYLCLEDDCRSNNQFELAIQHFKRALEITKEHGCKQHETEPLVKLGDAWLAAEQFELAKEYFEFNEALSISRKRQDKEHGQDKAMFTERIINF